MKTLTTAIAAALVLVFATQATAEPDIKKFDPGKYVMGPKFSGKHLKNKVIVVEYWGITCPPCIKAIPKTTELADKYGHDKLAIIANQSWSATVKQTKEVWQKHAKNNMVMVTTGGKMPGFKPKGVPAAVIFDHNLKPVWQGNPFAMAQPLEKAIQNLPKPEEGKADAKAGASEFNALPQIPSFNSLLGQIAS